MRNVNSWHYCQKVSLEALFEDKSKTVSDLFDGLLMDIIDWENVSFSATKNCIVFVHKKTFLVVKPMQKALNVKFYLSHFSETPPIFKCVEWSGKFETQIRLTDLEDLTPSLFSLLRASYNL